jgi:hypothetical protein
MRAIPALLLVFGLLLAGCDTGGGGSKVDNNLVAMWHSTQQAADNGQSVVFEITADGVITGEAFPQELNVTASGGRIKATTKINGKTQDAGEAAYMVEGTTLKFSNGTGVFVPLITGQDLSTMMDGDGKYHKKAGG